MKLALTTAMFVALEGSAMAAPTPEDLHNQGQAAYDHADYATAIVKWQASYKLSGASGLLFNLALAHRLGGDCQQALSTFKQFVAIDPKADERPRADAFIRELEPICGAPAQAPSIDRPIAKPGRTTKLAGLVTGGAGVVVFATGLGFGHRAATLGDEVTRDCATSCEWSNEKAKESTGRRYATVGRVLDGAGIAAIAVGVGLYVYGVRNVEPALAIQPHQDGATVTWSGRW